MITPLFDKKRGPHPASAFVTSSTKLLKSCFTKINNAIAPIECLASRAVRSKLTCRLEEFPGTSSLYEGREPASLAVLLSSCFMTSSYASMKLQVDPAKARGSDTDSLYEEMKKLRILANEELCRLTESRLHRYLEQWRDGYRRCRRLLATPKSVEGHLVRESLLHSKCKPRHVIPMS